MATDGTDLNVGAAAVIASDTDSQSEEGEDDDDDDTPNLQRLLSEFRLRWQAELTEAKNNNSNRVVSPMTVITGDPLLDKEKTALALFKKGILAEQTGHLTDAVSFYRRAVQLVPDIESKIDYREFIILPCRERNESESSVESIGDEIDETTQSLEPICQPVYYQNQTHISALPVEILMYIIKWVISDDLDLHSLEMISMVCKAWYRLARDEELWKLVCSRVWGINRGSRKSYGSWRSMFIERPHLRFNGVYISKSSYMRQGEKGIDNFYDPWHVVEYYRYIRFFPDGVMIMLTSPEDPLSIITKLRCRDVARQGLLRGYYKMTGSTLTGILKRVPCMTSKRQYGYRKLQNNQHNVDQTFHVEFNVVSSGRRKCYRLVWTKYTIHSQRRPHGDENISHFDLNKNNYPPLFFSCVKCYTALSCGPLT